MRKLYEKYPDTIEVSGSIYKIETDFRKWLELADVLQNPDIPEQQRVENILYMLDCETWNYPQNIEEAIINIMAFYTRRDPDDVRKLFQIEKEKEEDGKEAEVKKEMQKKPLFDWNFDAEAIQASFMQSYGIDLERVGYMHWHKFRTYFDFLPSETEIKQRIMYRGTDAGKIKDKKEKERVLKIQREIRIPSPRPKVVDIGNLLW